MIDKKELGDCYDVVPIKELTALLYVPELL